AGFITAAKFIEFMDANKSIREIEISNCGEVFLNPEIIPIMKAAFERGVELTITNGTNFNSVSDEVLEAMATYRVKCVQVAIDGACQETYGAYRRGGDFDKVVANIRKLNEFKRIHHSTRWQNKPWVIWQYIILPTNDAAAEIRAAQDMAAGLGVPIFFIRDRNGHVPADAGRVEIQTGLSFAGGAGGRAWAEDERKFKCPSLWRQPQINWDGRFYGCACNEWQPFDGNVFTDGLKNCMRGKLFQATKKMLMGGKVAAGSPCIDCPVYRDMAKTGFYITKKELI
ncbi:MAG: hypothetical protein LBG89_00635, partial [Rickettsiales bacterium]|nr:hypothetical protein [Rickettsiales bacterium]